MPEETPAIKIEATRRLGAQVVLCGPGQREAVAEELVGSTGGVLIPPFRPPRRDRRAGHDRHGDRRGPAGRRQRAGAGQRRRSGLRVGTAIRALCPGARVFGVEPELAADTSEGLRLGRRVNWSIEDRNRTLADGLRSQPSELTFAHLQRVLDDVLTVTEEQILDAVAELARRAHLVAEPSGAVALAAYRNADLPPGPTVVLVSAAISSPRCWRRRCRARSPRCGRG